MELDPRTVEDLIERGRRSLLKSADEDTAAHETIQRAADWLLAKSRELRRG